MTQGIPIQTVQTVARSIYKEATKYGFGPLDIIRLINELMDLAKSGDEGVSEENDPGVEAVDITTVDCRQLPVTGSHVKIREFSYEQDRKLFDHWLPDRYGKYFTLSCATAQEVTIESPANSPRNHLGIITLLDDTPIGAMAYLDHSKTQKRAELRKLIGEPEARGKGYAEQATRLWIQYGLQSLGLEKIYVSTLQTHLGNIQLNEDVEWKDCCATKFELPTKGMTCCGWESGQSDYWRSSGNVNVMTVPSPGVLVTSSPPPDARANSRAW